MSYETRKTGVKAFDKRKETMKKENLQIMSVS